MHRWRASHAKGQQQPSQQSRQQREANRGATITRLNKSSGRSGSSVMNTLMTVRAGGDQVLFRVRPTMAPENNMVDLQVGSSTAKLASPVVARKNL
jgi:hypothetical protein